MRFDANGDTLWTRVFGDPNGSNFWSGQQAKRTMDEGFLIVGFTGPIAATSWLGFALRTDLDGNELWRATYPWPGSPYSALSSFSTLPGGDLFMCGTRFMTVNNGDYSVQRTDGSGGLRWRVSWGGPFTDGITQVATGSDGHALACGIRSYAAGYTSSQPYLAKLDSSDGSIMWEKEYGPKLYSHLFYSLQECPDGNVIAAGRCFEQPGPTVQKGLLALTSAAGDSLWKYYYFYVDTLISTGQGTFYDVIQTQDGGFIAAGSVNNPVGQGNPPGYSQDTWVVKVDADGCIIPGCNSVGIAEQATNLLGAISIWPNPAHGQTTVQLTLPPGVANGPFELTLVATDGRVVRRERIAGNGEHTLALHELPAGMYYVHVADGGKWLTGGKLMVE
ncbi:MAG: T9SS type A sorting domain-containing protein [Flavobacteriales bacterium]|nr:T9SS type A sorting domain-containing protein [Flavobacteriales bacterium]